MFLLGWNMYSKNVVYFCCATITILPFPKPWLPFLYFVSTSHPPKSGSPSYRLSRHRSHLLLCDIQSEGRDWVEKLFLADDVGVFRWRTESGQNFNNFASYILPLTVASGLQSASQSTRKPERERGRQQACALLQKPWNIRACAHLEGLKTFDHNRERSVSEFSIIPSQLPRYIRLHRKFSSPKKRKAWSSPPNLTVLYFLLCPWGENTETSLQGIVAHKDI